MVAATSGIAPYNTEVPLKVHMTMKCDAALRVVAHELRSPVGVIAGYVRLLNSGRLDDAGREEALRHIERAAARLGDIGQQAADVAEWLEPRVGLADQMMPVRSILEGAARAASAPDRVRVACDDATAACQLRTSEPQAVVAALAAVIDATVRDIETPGAEITVALRHTAGLPWCDVVVGPHEWVDGIQELSDERNAGFNLDCGGLGLRLILGTAVFVAHGARLWASDAHRGLTGVRLPLGRTE